MVMRPDLFDPHSVHFHGFPQAASVFDGVPESSTSRSTWARRFTYFYKIVEPGTYMYHCHVEATEHMQMGMLGNLYVEPRQNGTPVVQSGGTDRARSSPTTTATARPATTSSTRSRSARSTRTSTTCTCAVQPLPFAAMRDKYPMLNGRGYPDTVERPDAAAADETAPTLGDLGNRSRSRSTA